MLRSAAEQIAPWHADWGGTEACREGVPARVRISLRQPQSPLVSAVRPLSKPQSRPVEGSTIHVRTSRAALALRLPALHPHLAAQLAWLPLQQQQRPPPHWRSRPARARAPRPRAPRCRAAAATARPCTQGGP
jgi:hypothetical protein